ncbi:type II toxin-antitoxin system HigA family antitoxin [Thiomonas sp. FB-6]|uniref:helix-turn-helix domain-containing protein n=1 Tax=Thiomonas sp. FB-6 TaxID=1158291 RepID=UPI00036D5FFF|nr:helix-turn-helix domain-containing protein [Thiomonas sp. FB-6]
MKIDWRAVADAWQTLETNLGPIGLAFTPENADAMMARVDSLLDMAEAPRAPEALHRLLAALSDWVGEYERMKVPVPGMSGRELLRYLMEENDLRQQDLADLVGGQSVVSDLLRGHRQINARQAVALAHRFRVDPAAFIVEVEESPRTAEEIADLRTSTVGAAGACVVLSDDTTADTASAEMIVYAPSYGWLSCAPRV